MMMPSDDAMPKDGTIAARRLEIFMGAGRRRAWTADQKAAIIAESYAGVGTVCDVARRHGLTPTQLFTWRRLDRLRQAGNGRAGDALFVPAIVEASIDESARAAKRRAPAAEEESPLIGVEVDGASLWVWRGADVAVVTAIVKAFKGGK